MDLYLAILEEKFVAIIVSNNNEEKTHYKVWKKSNRLSLMLMGMTIVDNIRTTLPKTKNAKTFTGLIEELS